MRERILEATSFEGKKQQYFTRLALSMREALTMHKVGRLWEKNKEGKKDWRNVSQHCLVEAARADTLAELLQLPNDIRHDLLVAAALHDFDKRQEIESMREAERKGESPLGASQKSEAEGAELLHKSGFSPRIVRFAEGTGWDVTPVREVKRVLDQEDLSDDDIAFLSLHYIDNYTRGSEWVEPVTTDASGNMMNEVDRRVEKNRANPAYARVSEEQAKELSADPSFSGKTIFDIMTDISHLIEERLVAIMRERTGTSMKPLMLPEIIDAHIKKRIEAI